MTEIQEFHYCKEILGSVCSRTDNWHVIQYQAPENLFRDQVCHRKTNRYLRAAALSQENVQHVLAAAVQYGTQAWARALFTWHR